MYHRNIRREEAIGPPSAIKELRFQRCTWCSTVVFRPCLLCPTCSATELRWERRPGRGRVCSAVKTRKKGQRPRMVTIVDLGDGVHVRCEVEGTGFRSVPRAAEAGVVEIAPDGTPVFRPEPARGACR